MFGFYKTSLDLDDPFVGLYSPRTKSVRTTQTPEDGGYFLPPPPLLFDIDRDGRAV